MKKLFTSMKYAMTAVALMLCGTAMAGSVTFDASSDKSGSTDAGEQTLTKDGITLKVSNGILGTDDGQYRTYKSQTLTISSTVGNILGVEFTCTVAGAEKYGPGCFTVTDGKYSYEGKVGTWTGDAASVVFTATSNQVRATKIVVTVDDGTAFVPAPVINPETGTYTEPQTVTITAHDGCEIWVNKQIGASFEKYTAPFTVSEDATITAYAVDATGAQSTTVTVAYTFVSTSDITGDGTAQNPYTVADVMLLFDSNTLPTEKVYVKGVITQVGIEKDGQMTDLPGSEYGNATYFIADEGSDVTLEIYRGKGLNGESMTTEDYIKVGDQVVVYGLLKLFNSTREMDRDNYIFSLNGQGGVVVEPDRYETIIAAAAAATDTHKEAYIAVSNVVVTYINGSNVYVLETSTGYGFLLYGTNGLPEGLKVGDVLQGTLFGELYTYHGLPELIPSSNNTALKVSGNMTIEANPVELSDLLADPASNASLLVKVESFMIDGTALTDKKVNINQYGDEAVMFDQFQVLTGVTFDPDAEYTATFITTVRDGVLQLYPINKDEFDQGGGEQPVENAYYTIHELVSAATEEHAVVTYDFQNNPLLVTYVSGKNIYVTDAATQTVGFLLFGSVEGFAPKAGDIIGGTMEGELYLYHGLPELAFTKVDAQVQSEGNNVEVNVSELGNIIDESKAFTSLLVRLEDVLFNASSLDGKSVGITQNGNEAVLWDQFGIAGGIEFSTEATYSLSVIVTVRDGVVQFYPTNRDELLVNEPQYEYEGEGTQEVPYTLADVQHLWVPKQPSNPVWVRGIIIGCVDGTFTEDKFSTTGIYPGAGKDGADKEVKSNIIIAPVENASKARKAVAGGYELSDCVPVALAAGSPLRDKLNIVDNPANVGKEVLLLGTIEDYFNIAGVKNLEDAIIDGTSLGVNGIAMDKEVLSGDIYTLAGQKVNAITRGGLYIIGGKKVFVK